MADDMANGNGSLDPLYGRLSERVENQGQAIIDIRSNMNAGFANIQTSISHLSAEVRGNSKPQWTVIWSAVGVSFAIIIAIGSQALSPIRDANIETKAAIAAFADTTRHGFELADSKYVSAAEMKWRSDRGAEDRVRLEALLADMRATLLPRNEWNEKNQSRDHDVANIREVLGAGDAAIQRQIDQIRVEFTTLASSLGNGRDTFADLKQEQARQREEIASLLARSMGFPRQ